MEECYFYLLKVMLLHGYFSRFLNYTIGTKSPKASHVTPSVLFNQQNVSKDELLV